MDSTVWFSSYFRAVNSVSALNASYIRLTTEFIMDNVQNQGLDAFKDCVQTCTQHLANLIKMTECGNSLDVLNKIEDEIGFYFTLTKNYLKTGELTETSTKSIVSEISTAVKGISLLGYAELKNTVNLKELIGSKTLGERIVEHSKGQIDNKRVSKIVRTIISNQLSESTSERVKYLKAVMIDDLEVNKLLALFDGVDWNILFSIYRPDIIEKSFSMLREKDKDLIIEFLSGEQIDKEFSVNRIIIELKNHILNIILKEQESILRDIIYRDTLLSKILEDFKFHPDLYTYVRNLAKTVEDFVKLDIYQADEELHKELGVLRKYIEANIAPRDAKILFKERVS